MKINTIILSYSSKDVEWACNYQKKNPKEKVYILTPTIEAQLVLKKRGLPYLLWFDIEQYEQAFLMDDKRSVYKKSRSIVKIFESNINITDPALKNINLVTILKDALLDIFVDIIHAYKLHKSILRKWKPAKIYIPITNSDLYKTGEGDFFSLAFYLKMYFKEQRVKRCFYYSSFDKTLYIKGLAKKLLKNLNLLKLLIPKTYYLVQTFNNKKYYSQNRKTILMETGGIITSYYYDFFKLVERKYNFLLITYKLQLHQQIPLLKRGIAYKDFNLLWKREYDNSFNSIKKSVVHSFSRIKNLNIGKYILGIDKNLERALTDQTLLFITKNIDTTLKKLIINFNLISESKPAFIINTHDPSPTGLSLVLPSKHNKIPIALLLHGLPIGKSHSSISSNYLITWGKQTQVFFKKHSNLDKNSVLSSGLPAIDSYHELLNSKIISFRSSQTLEGLNLGILLTNYHPNDSYLTKFLFELASILKNSGIIINYRLHEGFKIHRIEDLGEEFNLKMENQSLQQLDHFILSNEIIISFDTTAIIWAMIYRKPLFYTSPIWGEGSLPIKKYNAAWIPKNAAELLEMLFKYIKNPNIYKNLLKGQRKFLEDYVGPLDGKSSKRLVNIVDKLNNTKV